MQPDLTVVAAVDNMCDLAEREEKEGEAVKPHSVGFLSPSLSPTAAAVELLRFGAKLPSPTSVCCPN